MSRSQKGTVRFGQNAERVMGEEEIKLENASGGVSTSNLEGVPSGGEQS